MSKESLYTKYNKYKIIYSSPILGRSSYYFPNKKAMLKQVRTDLKNEKTKITFARVYKIKKIKNKITYNEIAVIKYKKSNKTKRWNLRYIKY